MPWSVAIMVVCIVLITMIGRVTKERYRALGRMQEPQVPASADAMRQAEDIRALRERIQVLERVITDNHGSADLDRQIEQLRDR